MLVDDIEQAFVGTIGAKKHLTLAIKDEFLQVKSHRFRYTEVLGVLRHHYFHLFTDAEEMVNGVPAGEDDRRILGDIDLLFSGVLGRNGLQPDERMEVHLDLIPSGQLEVGRFVRVRTGLGDQDLLDRCTRLCWCV